MKEYCIVLCCAQGDSGGPFACKDDQDRWTVIGVISFADGANGRDVHCTQSAVARVTSYVDWIHNIIASE